MILSFTPLSFEIFLHKTNKCCDSINKKGDPTQFDISVLNLLLLEGYKLTAFIHFSKQMFDIRDGPPYCNWSIDVVILTKKIAILAIWYAIHNHSSYYPWRYCFYLSNFLDEHSHEIEMHSMWDPSWTPLQEFPWDFAIFLFTILNMKMKFSSYFFSGCYDERPSHEGNRKIQ